jgi:hypothetical protein
VPAERAAAAWVLDLLGGAVDSVSQELMWGFAATVDWIEARVASPCRPRRKAGIAHRTEPAPHPTRRPIVAKRR